LPSAADPEEELKRGICRVMRSLYRRGLVSALSGNVSARLPGSKEFWVTPSGVFKGGLRPDDLVKLDLNGRVVAGSGRPSVEAKMHAAVYRVRPDVNAVVHAHNPFTVALASAGVDLDPSVSAEALAYIGSRIEVAPYAPPGSVELAELVAERAARGVKAIVLQSHGVVSLGSSLHEAEAVAEALEEVALIHFVALALGKQPRKIPPPR